MRNGLRMIEAATPCPKCDNAHRIVRTEHDKTHHPMTGRT